MWRTNFVCTKSITSRIVIGNDVTISVAAQTGNFELNVMLPLIASTLSNSIELLGTTARTLADSAIADFTANEDRLLVNLHRNPVLATVLNPVIGYPESN